MMCIFTWLLQRHTNIERRENRKNERLNKRYQHFNHADENNKRN